MRCYRQHTDYRVHINSPQFTGVNAVLNDLFEYKVSVSRHGLLFDQFLPRAINTLRKEDQFVLIRIFKPELDLIKNDLSKGLDRVLRSRPDTIQFCEESRKKLFAYIKEQFILVFKIKIDGCRRIVYFLGELPHRKMIVPVIYKYLAG